MSDLTPNLAMPYLAPAQAQKHVTHNEALRMLDAIIQIGVKDRDLAAPPTAPGEGDRYLVAASPTGAWAGKAGQIAAWQDGAWAFYPPKDGWLVWVADEDKLIVSDGAAWAPVGGGASVNPTALVGVNATADTINRLAVAAAATLLNHEGAGHQLKINKAALADTASLLFQRGFSGRAEFGLMGDDDFRLKVSADGAAWKEALKVDRATGVAALPFGPLKRNNAASAPTVHDDAGAGYAPGAVWFDTTTRVFWDCHDATAGVARWEPRLIAPLQPLRMRANEFYDGGLCWSPSVSDVSDAAVAADAFWTLPLFVNARQRFTAIGVRVGGAPAASAEVTQVHLAIYRGQRVDAYAPPVLAADCGRLSVGAGTGVRTRAIDVTLDPGLYWLAGKINANGATGTAPNFRAMVSAGARLAQSYLWAGGGGEIGGFTQAPIGHYQIAAVANWAAWTPPADLTGIGFPSGATRWLPFIALRTAA